MTDVTILPEQEDILPPGSNADAMSWQAHARVEKWHDTANFEIGMEPDEIVDAPGNLLTTVGIARLGDLLIGAGGQAFNNANSRLGVGTSATAATIADTDLNGVVTTNRYWMTMDATFPSRAASVITWKATYGTAVANFAWAEWGIDAGTAAGTGAVTAPLLNHKVTSLGTKASGATWVFTVTVTIS